MNIQSNVANSMTYEGKLTLRCKNNNKIYEIHNAGTQALTNLIVRALAGFNVSNNLPQFLGFNIVTSNSEYNEDGTEETIVKRENSLLSKKIPFTGITYETPLAPELSDEADTVPKSSLKLTAAILPTDMHNSGNIAGSFELVMYDSDNNRLATISDDRLSSMYQAVCSGVEAIIEWEMIFTCKREGE